MGGKREETEQEEKKKVAREWGFISKSATN